MGHDTLFDNTPSSYHFPQFHVIATRTSSVYPHNEASLVVGESVYSKSLHASALLTYLYNHQKKVMNPFFQ